MLNIRRIKRHDEVRDANQILDAAKSKLKGNAGWAKKGRLMWILWDYGLQPLHCEAL